MIEKINDRISIFFTEEGFSKSNSILINDDLRVMIDSGAGKILEQAAPGEADLLLNSRGAADAALSGAFTEERIDYNSSLVPGMNNEFFVQERDLWQFNHDGTMLRQFRLCSGRDFRENITLYEKVSHKAYVGCLVLIFRVFDIKIKAMP